MVCTNEASPPSSEGNIVIVDYEPCSSFRKEIDMRYRDRIYLETESDIVDFISCVTPLGCPVVVTDGEGMRVNAKSMLGMLYAMTFSEMWCECDKDIYMYIRDFCAE